MEKSLSGPPGDRYRIDEKVGEGGVGAVFSGWDTQLKRRVAIKRLRDSGKENPHTHESVISEATNLATLQHPNIVTIYDIGTDAQGPFAVMEFVDGEDVDDVVARSVFILEDFVVFARQVLEGLQAAHEAGLIHRDLKPCNVMLKWLPDATFRVKLLDFGLAKLIHTPSVQSLDKDDTLLGSIHTMAPEQFSREPLDARSDLYSAGCIFYYTLTGNFPFDGPSLADVMAGHLEHRVVPLAQYRPDLPAQVCHWVMTLIARKPEERPASAKVALAKLNELVGGPLRRPDSAGPLAMDPRGQIPEPPAQKKSSRRPLAAAILLAALLGLSALGWWQQQQQQQSPSTASLAPTPKPEHPFEVIDKPPVASILDARTMMDPENAPLEVFAATDLAKLRGQVGNHVIVHGLVVKKGENRTGTIRYLNFDSDYKNAVSLVLFGRPTDPPPPPLDLDALVGKQVRADGVVTEFEGALQIAIRSASQISLLSK